MSSPALHVPFECTIKVSTPISFSLFPFSLSLLVKEAEKMVAYLQDSDDRLAAKSSAPKPAGLPLTHEAALKWFYKDPQGEMQGKTEGESRGRE